MNRRYREIINESPNDAYITAFSLDPRKLLATFSNCCSNVLLGYRNAEIYKNPNPLSTPSITLSRVGGIASIAPVKADERIMKRVGLALKHMIQNEYGPAETLDNDARKTAMAVRNPDLAKISPGDANDAVKPQLKAYLQKREPFDRRIRSNESVLQWWKDVQKDDYGKVISVSVISFCCVLRVSHSNFYRPWPSNCILCAPTRWLMSERRHKSLLLTMHTVVARR